MFQIYRTRSGIFDSYIMAFRCGTLFEDLTSFRVFLVNSNAQSNEYQVSNLQAENEVTFQQAHT